MKYIMRQWPGHLTSYTHEGLSGHLSVYTEGDRPETPIAVSISERSGFGGTMTIAITTEQAVQMCGQLMRCVAEAEMERKRREQG